MGRLPSVGVTWVSAADCLIINETSSSPTGKDSVACRNGAYQLCFNVSVETNGGATGVARAWVCLHDSNVAFPE